MLVLPPAISLLSCTFPEFAPRRGTHWSLGCPVPTVLPPLGALIAPAAFTFVYLNSSPFESSNEPAEHCRAIVFRQHGGRLQRGAGRAGAAVLDHAAASSGGCRG